MTKKNITIIVAVVVGGAIVYGAFYLSNKEGSLRYNGADAQALGVGNIGDTAEAAIAPTLDPNALTAGVPSMPVIVDPEMNVVVTHVSTPEAVRAIYLSSWIAGSQKSRARILNIFDTTEINAVVIDIKDYTGRVSYRARNPLLQEIGSAEKRIPDIRQFIETLHQRNIYVIGRVSVFQDQYLTVTHPEWAITKKSTGEVWKDAKGLAFLDPTSTDVWKYISTIATESYIAGFDEVNFDYIRYPSDGDIKNIDYKLALNPDGTQRTRADNIEAFFKNLHDTLKQEIPDLKTSADLFGLATTSTDDIGIGQVLERALPYFDYIAPMVYPSHYANGEYGIPNPSKSPYQTITYSMKHGIDRAVAAGYSPQVFRPWLQDFSIHGVKYDEPMIEKEMQAVYDLQLDSWMMWDPSNKYTVSAFAPKNAVPVTDSVATPE